MSVLDVLGCRHGTEKGSNAVGCKHNYLPFYEQFLAPLRDKAIVLLEIGVDKGNSLRMWRDYFQRGHIVGMDNADLKHLSGPRMQVVIGDQNNRDDLLRVSGEFGPFDVIVDDAGHDPEAQKACHEFMLDHLKPGGFYILEDLVDMNGPFPNPACLNYLRDLSVSTITTVSKIESIAFSYGTSVTRIRNDAST